MMKKWMAACLAVCIAMIFCLPAAGAEGSVLRPLAEAAERLLLDTSNVTIRGSAVFTLEGERFKTAEILYKQDANNSHWQLDLKTPRENLPDRETGYTIIGNEINVYVMERYYPGTYTMTYTYPSNTVLRRSTGAELMFAMAEAMAEETEKELGKDALTAEASGGVRVQLTRETTPEILNTFLNLAAEFALRRFMDVDYDRLSDMGRGAFDDYDTVTQALLYTTDRFVAGNTDFTVSRDEQGRLSALKGEAEAIVSSGDGKERSVKVAFDFTMGEYGSTEVKTFDAAEYHVVQRKAGEQPVQAPEADPETAENFSRIAREALTLAGYDNEALPETTTTLESGLIRVSFREKDSGYNAVSVLLHGDGGVLTLTDHREEWFNTEPREPSLQEIPAETAEKLAKFVRMVSPERADECVYFIPDLEFVVNGIRYMSVTAETAEYVENGVVFVIRTEPEFRIVSYDCTSPY